MGVEHIRVELFGNLMGGAERWSAGFSLPPLVGSGTQPLITIAEDTASAFDSQWEGTSFSIGAYMPLSTSFLGAKATHLADDGSVLGTASKLLATPDTGTQELALPPQCAIVVSLRTPTAGARGRGRMYLPGPGTESLTDNGRLQGSVRDALAARMVDFIGNVNSLLTPQVVGVASNVGGFITTVTAVAVGDVVDTQRRRRDALPEGYVTIDL